MSGQQKKILPYFIIIFTSFLLGLGISHFSYKYTQQYSSLEERFLGNRENLDLKEFWTVYNLIEEEFFSETGVQKENILYGAIKGMVDGLGDEHSEFLTPEEANKFYSSLSGDFEGIGAVVEKVPLGVQIERILHGSPAKKYGLFSGDIIVSANGQSLENLDIYDAVEKIKGPAGSEVLLEILRVGEESMIIKRLIRQKIHIPSVEIEEIDDTYMYIALNIFGDESVQEFKKALVTTIEQKRNGIIIDLRDNGGGYLGSAVDILSYFIDPGELLVETRYKKQALGKRYYSKKTPIMFSGSIVILVNENSASASEIVAGVLREYNKAIIVGEKTFGKGSVQEAFELSSQSLVKLTVAKWFTPEGKNIELEGITPDIIIPLTKEDFEDSYDRQLEEAKKILEILKTQERIGLIIEKYNQAK